MLEQIIENFPTGTTETARKLLTAGMSAGEKLGERLSDLIDSAVDSIFK